MYNIFSTFFISIMYCKYFRPIKHINMYFFSILLIFTFNLYQLTFISFHKVVGYYFSVDGQFTEYDEDPIKWISSGPPKDHPPCGFYGEYCGKGTFNYVKITRIKIQVFSCFRNIQLVAIPSRDHSSLFWNGFVDKWLLIADYFFVLFHLTKALSVHFNW